MSNFIQRRFENIKTNEIETFYDVKKTHIQVSRGGEGFDKQHQSTIAVILGEPASGKTYQLREENKNNPNSYFIELINLKDDDIIDDTIEIVLLDSIDEALTDYDNPKKLQDKLVNFIKRCQKINPKVRFIISCRFLEWSNYFEDSLKEIDKELRVYKILPLSKEDINYLLHNKSIKEEEFWKFIEDNYLDEMLKNILIVFHLIEKFSDYKTRRISFIDIYNDIVKKYLSQKGEDRQEEIADKPLDELVMIASSLATYMSLNRVSDIDTTNLSLLANELYKVNGNQILESDLKQILNRGLFDKRNGKLVFFHNTIQEYLVAYCIDKKDLSAEQIKELFSSELRFYEEFEEIIVYLTNIREDLFDDFVEFDPFIFKRHPNLTKEQQKKLLLSILNKYKTNFSQVWGRWESFEDSTLVKFHKLDNLITILKEQVILKEHGYYLMKLLKNNYSEEFKKYMFELFEKNISDKKTLENVIRGGFIDNYKYNLSLYEFLKKHNLLKKDKHVLMMSFEAELFSSLYGIKYKYKYGQERTTKRTDIDFKNIVSMLDFVPSTSLKYIAPYLLKNDTKQWFQYIIDRYENDKYNNEIVGWVVHAVLKYCDSEESLIHIAKSLQGKKINLYSINRKEMKLDFENIQDIFWKVYFEEDILQDFRARKIVSFYDISLDDIKKATYKYPVKEYIEKYVYFRLAGNDVDKFLMQDKDFKRYMQNEWKRQEEQQKKFDREFEEEYPYIKKQKEEEKQYFNDCIERFGTEEEKSTDYHNIFRYALNEHQNNITELNQFLQKNLSEKYAIYISRIKQNFKTDTLYKNIKKDLLSSSIYYDTILYSFLFEILDEDELKQMLKTRKDYIKLFWHIYKITLNSFSDKFIKLSEKYFDCFVLLSLHALQITLKQSKYKEIGNFSTRYFKNLKRFDKFSLKPIISYLEKNKNIIPILNNTYDKKILAEILMLDKKNYSYILEIMIKDKNNMSMWLRLLLRVDTKKALEDYYKIYNKTKRYKSIMLRIKETFQNKEGLNIHYNPKINNEKIELYMNLLTALRKLGYLFDKIPSNYYVDILNDYYKFFTDYERPKGEYSLDIYDHMYSLINKIWNHLEDSKYIDILQKLRKSKNTRLLESASYALTKAYEEQRKNKNFPNSNYKKIFDKDENMKDKYETHIHGDVYGSVHNHGEIKQTFYNGSKDDKKESWYKKWWIISLTISAIIFGVSYWNFKNVILSSLFCIITFAIMLILNPKRRFFRMGLSLIFVGGILNIISFTGKITIPDNSFIYGFIELKGHDFSIQGIVLIIASIFLFWLDHKENKNDT